MDPEFDTEIENLLDDIDQELSNTIELNPNTSDGLRIGDMERSGNINFMAMLEDKYGSR